jgi:hypothetical protein
MDDSDLLAFTPVPLRARRDGWTAKKQYFFILGLARGFTVARAAGLLGLSRKTAYELRRKPGGAGFAAAWDAAVERARVRRIEGRIEARAASLVERGLHGEWVPRLYRGRLVGWTHKVTSTGLMRVLARLDKMAACLPADAGAREFDRLLGFIDPERDSPDPMPCAEGRLCHVPPPAPLPARRSAVGGDKPGAFAAPPETSRRLRSAASRTMKRQKAGKAPVSC